MRPVDVVLRKGLERANPVTCDIVEISAPDSQRILRRANDQFFTAPPRVSETPGGTTAADVQGGMMLAPTNSQIASFYTEGALTLAIPGTVDPSTSIKGVGWSPNADYGRAVIKKFTARFKRNNTTPIDLQLHIYRPKPQRFFWRNPATGAVQERWGYTFVDILADPLIVRYATLVWTANHTDVVFDLSSVRPEIGSGKFSAEDPGPFGFGGSQHFIFAIDPVNPPKGGVLEWKIDQVTPTVVPGVGGFAEVAWSRAAGARNDPTQWGVVSQAYSECFKLEIETYPVTSQIVYAIDLPSVPIAASTGRVVFERGTPPGTSATLELSTAGSGGPWTTVKHGDVVATKQPNYHLRVTLNANSTLRQTPRVAALGLDFRTPVDVSAEVSIEPVSHEVQMPFCQAGVGEGRATIVRAGRRDYRDIASDLAVGYPTSKLECDHYIGSRHPAITRDRWYHLERAAVTNREPVESSESFGLLSPLKALKKKIPARVETINTVHTVQAGTTASQVILSPDLQDAPATGAYAGQGYYMRVRTSSQVGVSSGFIQTIDNNTNQNRLDFTTVLPGTLVAGDVVEVHSARYAQPVREWVDTDPFDIWYEILTSDLLIPAERIGFAGVGEASRSGYPPRVSDRAPGDATTQAKLKVTMRLQAEEDADKIIDQLSFIMGGCTVAIGGQIAFRQIFALRDANDDISVPTATPEVVLDPRDYSGLQTPTGVEGRITTLSCDYGVNATLVSNDTQAAKAAAFVDADAVAWLATQDVEGLGRATIAKDISRWCYNSTDEGLFLATQLNKQVVRVASTGLRVWSFTTNEQHPQLHVGESLTVVTDQYSDYDPTRKLEIRGWWAFRAIVVGVQAGGRRFRVLIPGLAGSVPVRGGAGTLADHLTELTTSLHNFRFIDSADGTQRTFYATAGSSVARVFVFNTLMVAPPTTDPWPAAGRLPDAILTPDVNQEISYTVAKPANGWQRFLQFEPRLSSLASGPVRRTIIDPAETALAPKISAAITVAYTADLTVDVVAGPGDWPVTVDVFEDVPAGTPIYSGMFAQNTTLDKNTAGASALGGRALPGRVLRLWWVRQTNVGGKVAWASSSSDRESQPWLESLEATWDEATGKLIARIKGGAFCGSVTVEADDVAGFGSPLAAQHFNLIDGGDVTAEFTLTQAERGKTWYVRATPFNGALSGGLPTGSAGVAQIAQFPVPVVKNDGTDVPQGTVAIGIDGSVTIEVDGPSWVGSYKYQSQTGSFPTEATVLASGVTLNGRQQAFDTGDDLVLGQSVYVTLIPFSGANATGYQGPAIRLKSTRHDATATKTVKFGAMAFTVLGNATANIDHFVEVTNGYIRIINHNEAGSPAYVDLFDNFQVPQGCTITAVSCELYADAATDARASYEFFRTDDTGGATSLGSDTVESGGWSTQSATMSESTTGRRYKMKVRLSSTLGTPGSTDARTAGWSITYTMPSTENAL